MLEFTKTDLARCDTVLKALKRGKYELEGEEVLAFAQSFGWLATLFERMKADIETPIKEPEVGTDPSKSRPLRRK